MWLNTSSSNNYYHTVYVRAISSSTYIKVRSDLIFHSARIASVEIFQPSHPFDKCFRGVLCAPQITICRISRFLIGTKCFRLWFFTVVSCFPFVWKLCYCISFHTDLFTYLSLAIQHLKTILWSGSTIAPAWQKKSTQILE